MFLYLIAYHYCLAIAVVVTMVMGAPAAVQPPVVLHAGPQTPSQHMLLTCSRAELTCRLKSWPQQD